MHLSRKRFITLLFTVAVLALSVAPTFAQDPTDPATAADFVTMATSMAGPYLPVVFATAVVGLGGFLLSRLRRASR